MIAEPKLSEVSVKKPESEKNLQSYQWTPITNPKKIELVLAPPKPPTDPGADKLIQLGFEPKNLCSFTGCTA